ncbi:hypothetical protein VTL71DRAFT_16514 [Oculimacula yallundae]|uniref:Uncharacterized protein n=1 Tax=Oculimacula yallundae TaxID=86028 RepID=A0ABR4CGP6_9HELO
MNSSTVVRDFATTIQPRAALATSQEPFVKDHWPRPPSPAPQPRLSSAGDTPTPIPFEDCRMSFAIDISQMACPRLPKEGVARVIPWDEISHPIITVEELTNIKPAGRTDPNVLLEKREHIDLLQTSHLWFLLTDGEIVPKTVHRFSLSINSRGLHGTACVIVIFGSLPPKPILCNVSVGISVFAVTPNCVFIFHDVATHRAYILQCKGCFNALLPRGWSHISLNNSTKWDNIPELHYSDLFDIRIPPPVKLDVNQFQLQSGEKVDLDDLYHGNLSQVIENKILQNEDNLKSVLLIALTRGRTQAIRDWIATRRDSFTDLVSMPRPDLNGIAATLVSEATTAFCDIGCNLDDFVFAKASNLRRAHSMNWDAFRNSVQPRTQEASQRGTVIDDSLARLDLIELSGPANAECMSPVSPGGGRSTEVFKRIDAVNAKTSTRLDRLTGAVVFSYPLSTTESINQETWISNIDRALDARIAPQCLLQVFLGIMFAAKEKAGFKNPKLAKTLGMACQKCTALYLRLVLHVVEYSNTLQDSQRAQIAAEFCALLRSQFSNGEDTNQILSSIQDGQLSRFKEPPPHHLLDVLVEKNLADEEVVRIRRQVKEDGFDIIEESCERALCLFVCLFHTLNITNKEPRQVLHWYCTRPEMKMIFEMPWELGNEEAKRIWEDMT